MAESIPSVINRAKVGVLLIGLGLALAVVAVSMVVHRRGTEPNPPPGALTSRSAPSSVKLKPQAVASYSVPPADPKYIAVSTIGISNTPIVKLGLTSGGAIAVPDNIYEAGWYEGSSKPGQAGAMFVYGHVSSWTADGVFYNLKRLVPGDRVVITKGDNTTNTYQVVSSKIYPYNKVDMNQVLSPISAGLPGLNLMTCTGQVIRGTSEFNERLVVFTSLISS